MSNRLLQEGSDARLESMFGDGPEEEAIPDIEAWEAGADEVAGMIGAQVCASQAHLAFRLEVCDCLFLVRCKHVLRVARDSYAIWVHGDHIVLCPRGGSAG